jgi:hypothetical protein
MIRILPLLAATFLIAEGAVAKDPRPNGERLETVVLKCSSRIVTVVGRDGDLRLTSGNADWTWVLGEEVTIYCGSRDMLARCDHGTDFVRVSRAGSYTVTVDCYRRLF